VWYTFAWVRGKRWLAWLLAILYAGSDEIHQSFVPGRYPSIWDVLVFDNLGALTTLWLAEKRFNQKRPDVSA
jgi:VanZ family protein